MKTSFYGTQFSNPSITLVRQKPLRLTGENSFMVTSINPPNDSNQIVIGSILSSEGLDNLYNSKIFKFIRVEAEQITLAA